MRLSGNHGAICMTRQAPAETTWLSGDSQAVAMQAEAAWRHFAGAAHFARATGGLALVCIAPKLSLRRALRRSTPQHYAIRAADHRMLA
ncbi:hypothetical protein ISP14_09960 [Dyella agri]|uniref:Uncharacterized protein n=1 Tax=Dyella agri TaxID=1926869 RepID=A0ABW8KG66_9GAMM